jgi:RHS repeat-associated protein
VAEDLIYDELNRLTDSNRNGASNLGVRYSPGGNILFKSDVGTFSYGDTSKPHAVTGIAGTSVGGFTYDAVGNVLSGLGCTVEYTSFNKPHNVVDGASFTSQQYAYGTADEIAVQSENGPTSRRTTLYGDHLFDLVLEDDDLVLSPLEFDRLVEQVSFVIHGRVVAVYATVREGQNTRSETQYLHYDHLGSLLGVLSPTGAVLLRASYDAFGKRRLPDWAPGYPLPPPGGEYRYSTRGFTGHTVSQATDLIHMGGRLYHAALGRFFSADPIISDVDSLQAYNAYSYVGNNPLSLVDPTGYLSWGSVGKFLSNVGNAVGGVFNSVVDAAKKIGKWIERNWRTLVVVAVAVVFTVVTFGAGAVGSALIVGALTGALTPALQGRPLGDILKGAVIGAVLGLITAGIGQSLGPAANFFNEGVKGGVGLTAAKAALHGLVGGLRGVLDGGKFWTGFATAAVAAGATVGITHIDNMPLETAATSVVGGITSEIAGGDFGDGAAIAAYSYLFNEWGSKAAARERLRQQIEAKDAELDEVRRQMGKNLAKLAFTIGTLGKDYKWLTVGQAMTDPDWQWYHGLPGVAAVQEIWRLEDVRSDLIWERQKLIIQRSHLY